MLILISDAFDSSLPEKLKKFGDVTDDKGRLAEANIVLVRSKTKCTKEYINSAPNLKLIIRGGVGLDNIDRPYAKEKGVKVFNTASASAIAVAELTMALMLAVPSNVVPGHTSMADGRWEKKQLKRTELWRKTLGLIGVGNIGTEVARRARAFDMDVIAFDPALDGHEIAKMVGSVDDIYEKADFISLHVPLLDSTEGMINASSIDKMKDGVIIVNTARAKCIVEVDMARALESGKVRGFGNDVWYSDPPPPDSPILKAPNVVMTPHIGASSKENLLRIGDVILDIIGKEAS
ncbi:MAG: hydroxyacid dehydrogenase [Deltaproteobacteria bacterium]|nr:hydroxyacid dehydrogenase [Deltaproteobacteria bacterium]